MWAWPITTGSGEGLPGVSLTIWCSGTNGPYRVGEFSFSPGRFLRLFRTNDGLLTGRFHFAVEPSGIRGRAQRRQGRGRSLLDIEIKGEGALEIHPIGLSRRS